MNSTNVHMKLFAYCNLHLDYLTNIWKCLKLVIALFILPYFSIGLFSGKVEYCMQTTIRLQISS